MSKNRNAAPMSVSVVSPQWVQVASTSRGTDASLAVETVDVGLFYLHVPIIPAEPRVQVGDPAAVDAVR